MHWLSFHITILVNITYWINPIYDLAHLESRIVKEAHYYISDKKEHDTLFVQNAFKLNWQFLQERGCFPWLHVVWNDGCRSNSRAHNVGTFYLVTTI
jgi:hypothetical protein